uniref:Uncharacterized protein n=1 Tax=Leersia perrieri TaxID=77586 RepID=A0A0D9XH76_9ORYZ
MSRLNRLVRHALSGGSSCSIRFRSAPGSSTQVQIGDFFGGPGGVFCDGFPRGFSTIGTAGNGEPPLLDSSPPGGNGDFSGLSLGKGDSASFRRKLDEGVDHMRDFFDLPSLKKTFYRDVYPLLPKHLILPGQGRLNKDYESFHHKFCELLKRPPVYLSFWDVMYTYTVLGRPELPWFLDHIAEKDVVLVPNWLKSYGKVEILFHSKGSLETFKAETDASYDEKTKEAKLAHGIFVGGELVHADMIYLAILFLEYKLDEHISTPKIYWFRVDINLTSLAKRLETKRVKVERLKAERLESKRLKAERPEAKRQETERLEAKRQEVKKLKEKRPEAKKLKKGWEAKKGRAGGEGGDEGAVKRLP